jgi:hypothetical protein
MNKAAGEAASRRLDGTPPALKEGNEHRQGGDMLRRLTVRKILLGAAIATVAAAVPLTVAAATGAFGGSLDHQRARWTTNDVSTSSTAWKDVPGLSITRCAVDQVTAMLNVTLEGGAARFRVVIDSVPEAPMIPNSARFNPQGIESFSFAFVRNVGPFEADDTHRFDVQWRSATGAPVTLRSGMLNLLFEDGTQGCP